MNKIKNWITEIKKTDRGKTLLRFSKYMVFFIAIFLFVMITNIMNEDTSTTNTNQNNNVQDVFQNTENNESEIKELTNLEKQKKLYEGTYKFTYKISGAITVNYTGEYNSGFVNGYKESRTDTTKYKIENGTTYKVLLDSEEIYNDLYLGLDTTLFDFKSLFDILNQKPATIVRNETNKTYTYKDINGYTIVITLNETEINQITIENESLKYELSFEY